MENNIENKILIAIEQINNNMKEGFEKTQEGIKRLGERVGNLEQGMKRLEERVGNLEQRVDDLEKEFKILKQKVGNLEKELKMLKNKVESLEVEIRNISGSVARIEVQHGEKIQILFNAFSVHSEKFYADEKRINYCESQIEKQDEKIFCLETRFDNAEKAY